jgi:hypothetical protein
MAAELNRRDSTVILGPIGPTARTGMRLAARTMAGAQITDAEAARMSLLGKQPESSLLFSTCSQSTGPSDCRVTLSERDSMGSTLFASLLLLRKETSIAAPTATAAAPSRRLSLAV